MKSLILLLCMFFDGGVKERLVVHDTVDLIEINHKYRETEGQTKKMFAQIIFWEWRETVLLPEIKHGKQTGSWYRGSSYIVLDYITLNNINFATPIERATISFTGGGCQIYYYDTKHRCQRIVTSRHYRFTHSLTDPEQDNAKILRTDFRKGLTPPDRHVRIVRIPDEIERLLDMEIEVK